MNDWINQFKASLVWFNFFVKWHTNLVVYLITNLSLKKNNSGTIVGGKGIYTFPKSYNDVVR